MKANTWNLNVVRLVAKTLKLRYSTGVVLKNVNITQAEGTGYSFANCKNVSVHGCTSASDTPDVFQYNSHNVNID